MEFRYLDYTSWKTITTTLPRFYVEVADGDQYDLIGADNDYCFQTAVNSGTADYTDFVTSHKTASTEVMSQNQALILAVKLRPSTSDGKPIFLPCAFPGDVMLYETGRGDDLTTGVRGDGEYLKFSSSTVEEPYKEIRFRDYIYLIGGQIQYLGGDVDDGVDFQVNFPATVVTSTPGTGNVNVSSYKIIPAPNGDGTHTLNLTEKYGANVGFVKAVPVPSSTQTGRYNYDDENHVLTVAPDADGAYNLYTVALSQIRQVREIPILGSGQVNLTFENIKAKKMLPQWVLKVTLHNRSGSTIKVRAFLITGRKTTI